jgi:hypothetical protein
MAETHEAKLMRNPQRRVTVEDPEPLRSAKLFKYISDKVWEQRRSTDDWAVHIIELAVSPADALVAMNGVARAIDERLVLASANEDVKLTVRSGENVAIPRSSLTIPRMASLRTYNWDESSTSRQIEIGGERFGAKFTDGHRDYARELGADFYFRPEGDWLTVNYAIERRQPGQGDLASLSARVQFSRAAESGCEGTLLYNRVLTEGQEIATLNAFAHIGGIAIEGF